MIGQSNSNYKIIRQCMSKGSTVHIQHPTVHWLDSVCPTDQWLDSVSLTIQPLQPVQPVKPDSDV